ncbi:leukotoxin LktA family filamentous adhesin, partial [Bradyrhizobium sp. WSM2254]|uniref:leukotoxin LktA family filamentous adhesin n=1 Tax=Bradyrhizobium sp. WSM2254 TaxID=1188263 RepID=UPI000676A983
MRGPSATRNNDELTLRGLARFRSMSLLCAMQMVFLPVFSVRLQAQTANVIVPDGRTGTSLHTSGSVTNVTTSTVSGNNAFNSFSQFSVGQGNTVNLQLPTGTQNLVNIVRDAPVYVNGTLNSYMNGAIGGNVYFADPKGFVVGRSGTVNVGSLNVSTPSREFTDSLIGAGGVINGTAVGNLMAGSFPVSPDGNIRIYGRVNAIDGVRLTGQNVYVGGATQRDIANLDHAAKFAASVNSKGLRSASAITVSNGSIHIGAVNNARVNGRLTARSKTTTPSNITVTAGNAIEVGKNARLSTASKTADAGNITLKTQGDLTVKSGAKIDASSAKGNGGLVDLSADGQFDIGNKVQINLAAPNGKQGTLVLDPVDIIIGEAAQGDANVNMSNATVAAAIAALNGTGTFTLLASNSITIAQHGRVDAGTGGVNVTLSAPILALLAGSYVRGDTVLLDSGPAGTITVNAATNGGAQVVTNTALQFVAAHLNLTSTATAFVGDGTNSANRNAAGFISNAAIARYSAAMGGLGDLTVRAATSITVDATGVIDTRSLDGNGASNGKSLDVALTAPTIIIASGGRVLTHANNTSDTVYASGNIMLDATGAAPGAVTVAGLLSGNNITVRATSVALNAGAVLDTRSSDSNGNALSNSGDVSVTAATIVAAAGSQILAGATNSGSDTYVGGGITLDASSVSNGTVSAAGTLTGASVSLLAGASISIGSAAQINAAVPSGTASITYQAPTVTVAGGAQFNADAVVYNIQRSAVIVGASGDSNASAAGFLSNDTIASYVAAQGGHGVFTLSALGSITVDANGVIAAGAADVALSAPTSITLAGLSAVTGNNVSISADTVSINAGVTGGTQLSPLLRLVAGVLSLTSSADMVVGDGVNPVVNLTNATINSYMTTVGGAVGALQLSASSSITVKTGGVIDLRHVDGSSGNSTGASANLALAAPTITIESGASLRTDVTNVASQTYYTPGSITLSATNITAGAGTINGGVVTFNAGAGTIHVGSSNANPPAGTVFLSNATIANYLAALAGTSTFALTATDSLYIDSGASIAAGGTRNVNLTASSLISFAANSTLTGNTVVLNAGRTGTLAVNAAYNGGATITAQSPLQLTASQVKLTSTDDVYIGNASTDTNASAAGFIDNATIARYVTALHGVGSISIAAATAGSATTTLTVDASARIDATRKDANSHSTANGVNVLLSAATVTVAAGAVIDAQAANAGGTTYRSGTVSISATMDDLMGGTAGGTLTIGGTVKGSSIALAAGGITVGSNAALLVDTRGSVRFGFWNEEDVNNSTGNNGSSGTLSNSAIASYIAAMQAGGTFVLSTLGVHTLHLTSTAVINGGSTVNVAFSSKALGVATGAQIIAGAVGVSFDQDNVYIGPTGDSNSGNTGFVSNDTIANLILAAASARTFTISANNSITLDANAVIDTRFLNGFGFSQKNALNVTLDAPTISIMQYAEIRAQAINNGTSFTSGDVSLTATASQTLLSGLASATTGITVDGKITGGNITIKAESTATSSMTSSILSDLAMVGETLGSLILGVNGGYVAANTVAKVAIGSHADIDGTGDVKISARGTQDAEDPVVSAGLGVGAVVGSVTADVSTIVSSGASIRAGQGILVGAATDTTLSVSTVTVTTAGQFLASTAIGLANIKTEATVNSGAFLSSGNQGLQVSANNYSNLSVSATAFGFSPLAGTTDAGGMGGAVAYSNFNVATTATMGANFGASGANQAGNLLVAAATDIAKNSTSASVTLGTPGLLNTIINGGAGASTGFKSVAGSLLTPITDVKLPFKVAGGLSLAMTSESANAAIAATNGGSAPRIYTSGDVAVVSQLIDDQIRNNSSSTVNVSSPDKGPQFAIAVAVAFGEYTHNSNAYVGANAEIHAADIGVAALTTIPNTNSWQEWNGLSDTFSHLNANFGVVNNIVTTYANANASGGGTVSAAGSFAYFGLTDNTTSWVGSGAKLYSTRAAGSTAGWTATANYNIDGVTISQGFASALTVSAYTYNTSIDIGGVFGPLVLLPGSDSPGTAAGGTLNLVQSTSNTIAGVSSGALLSSQSDVSVTADTTDLLFAIAPTSGSSSGSLALNGILSLAFIDNTTHASISSLATVISPRSVQISADQNVSLFSLTGAIQLGTTSGVGVSAAYMTALTDTAAYIGDNRNDIVNGPFSADDPNAISGSGGQVTTKSLQVNAVTAGRVTVAAVAAVESDPFAQVGYVSKITGVYKAAPFGGLGALTVAQQAAAKKNGTPKFNIDIAGSSAVSSTSLDTSAYVKGVTVNSGNPYTVADAPVIQVQALNNTIISNGSGSGALNLAGGNATSAAIAGAIAIALSSNSTTAYIANSTITDETAVNVRALSGGSLTAVALALSATRTGTAASVSVSVGSISDTATAYIDGSTITGVSGGTANAANVNAYQTSNIAIGGGSLYLNGDKNSAGLAITYAEVRNPGGGNAVDAHISSSNVTGLNSLTVIGDDASVIAAGAASGGYAENGLAGSIVVDSISPSVLAYITSSTVTVSGGNVRVNAVSIDDSGLDNALASLVRSTNNGQLASDNCITSSGSQACVDFSGAVLNGGVGNGPGAAITSIAGILQAGKNNIGVAIVVDAISTTHSAFISQTQMTVTTGDVLMTAEDSSKIQSVAIGFGLATGQFAGQGGAVISTIRNDVSAVIGGGNSTPANTVVSAGNVVVQALERSSIISTAAVGGASTQGSAGGLSIVYSEIDNQLTAGITGARITAGSDVVVNATSNASISTVAVGVALSSQVGIAGSVATNVMGTNVTAGISGGADVLATNNVGVLANNTDGIAVFAGAFSISTGSVGGAGSMVTNKIDGSTSAFISGASTRVDALGTSSSDTLSVNSGTLAHAFSVGSFSAPTDNTPDLTETQETVKGLAVVASSHQAVVANVASLAASTGIAIMINPIVNVMSGTTRAYIDSASIDTRLTSSTSLPQIDVAASSFSYSGTFGVGIVAPTASTGGGATIISTTMSRQTFATVTNATVGGTVSVAGVPTPTVGAVTVKSNAEQDASSVAVGFNSGSVGLNVFLATTEAYVDGGALTANSLSVRAADSTGIASANGSGAYGSSVAIGAAFVVQVSSNTTEAYIGDEFHYRGNSASAHSTAITLSGALNVSATTTDNFQAYSIGGAVSTGSVAIAGMANIEIANNTTIAGIYDTNVQSATGGAVGAISVNATEVVNISEIAGALAVGASGSGIGVGAAVNVISFKSQTIAETRNSNLNSSGTISVVGQSTKEILSYAVTAGIGGSVGIGATVGVIVIGTNVADADTQGQESGQLSGTLGAANNGTNSGQGSGAVANGTAGAPSGANASSTYNVSTVLEGGNDGVTAQIAGGHVTANEIDVGATSASSAQMFLLGAGFGKNAGVGAAIGFATVNSSVLANLNAIAVAPTVNVLATVQDPTGGSHPGRTIDIQAVAGGGGLYFGGDAAVAVGTVANTVTAEIGGQIADTASNLGYNGTAAVSATTVNVSANDSTSQRAQTEGASVGLVAVGASVTAAKKTSSVTAQVLDHSTINATTVGVTASDAGLLWAYSVAVSGGVVSGNGSAATATDDAHVRARVGSYASITTGHAPGTGLIVTASDTPDAEAYALGIVAGGAAVGASVATATVSSAVSAEVLDHASLTGNLTVSAYENVQGDGNAAYTNATGASGGVFLGLQATASVASNTSDVSATIGDNVSLSTGNVTILAKNTTGQSANATGIAASGILAVGVVVANANASTTTTATIGNNINASNAGLVKISAIGVDNNYVHAISGSGGTFAGNGASANTSDSSTVIAGIGNGNRGVTASPSTDNFFSAASLAILASHIDNYTTSANTGQAAMIGASGAASTHTANSVVTAGIGTNNTIAIRGTSPGHCDVADCAADLTITATNAFNEVGSGPSASAGAGGGINGVGASSQISLGGVATINIGKNTHITAGNDTIVNPGNITMLATSMVTGNDSVTLVTGGGIEGAGVSSSLTATVDNNINIGAASAYDSGTLASPSSAAADRVVITSFGTIGAGTYTRSTASTSAYANTYGVAFVAAAAFANTSITSNQNIVVGASVLTAFDNINLTAGQSSDGGHSTYMVDDASAVSFARGLIAVPDAHGVSSINNNTSVNIAAGASVNSGQNIVAGGYSGAVRATATGSGHGYELGFIPASDGHSDPSSSAHAELTVSGALTAGIYNSLLITISCNSVNCLTVAPGGAPFSYSYTNAFNGTQLVNTYFDPEVRSTLINGLSSSPNAFSIGQLFASGGTVTLNADHITGNGAVTAKGAPTISVNNQSDANLVINGAYISIAAVGDIFYTGSASGFAAGSTPTLTRNPHGISTIAINNSYNPPDFSGTNGPTLLVLGDITNVNGVVTINNTLGSYGMSANLTGQQVQVTVPNGAVAVSANDPSGIYLAGGSPFSEWRNFMVYPGGNPSAGAPVGDIAAAYLANTLFPTSPNADELNHNLYGAVGEHGTKIDGSPANISMILFGDCAGFGDHCISYGDTYANNWHGVVRTERYGNYDFNYRGEDAMQPYIQYFALNKTSDTTLSIAGQYAQADLSGSRNSFRIFGSQVAIKASVIDINGSITAGRQTNYNINLGADLSAPLVLQTSTQTITDYNSFGCMINPDNCTHTVTTTTPTGGALSLFQYNYQQAVANDPTRTANYVIQYDQFGQPLVTYNAITNQVTVANINASSGGGSVLIDGKIISTNQYGNIHVNGGYGNVSINNQTGLDLVVKGVNTGNTAAAAALTSTVTLVDRNITSGNNTSTYVYSPATNVINKYMTANGAAPNTNAGCSSGNNCSTTAGTDWYYDPVRGLRFQWVQQAEIHRADHLVSTSYTFSGNPNQPWSYVTPSGQLSTTPQGTVVMDLDSVGTVFKETITGRVTDYSQVNITYNHCDGSTCSYGFYQNNPSSGDWNYNFVNTGTLSLTTSVKADNRFGVNFGGNASGLVNVTSNGNVIVAGSIVNPNGALSVASSSQQQLFNTTTGGNISQTSTGSILTQSANFIASGGIGSLAAPIRATLSNSGSASGALSAQAGVDGVYLNLASGATLGRVSSGSAATGFGDVNITATGDLLAGANAQVTGRNITMISTLGSIGSITNPLPISANAAQQADGSYKGGIVNVVAHGDIGLTQTAASADYSSDLRVGLIASASGDVLLNVPYGTILDASGQTASQTLTSAQVAAVSSALHLTALDGANDTALGSVIAFSNTVNRNLAVYAGLMQHGTVQAGAAPLTAAGLASVAVGALSADDYGVFQGLTATVNSTISGGVLTLTANGLTQFKAAAATALGITNPTAAQIQSYANGRYQAYAQTIQNYANAQGTFLLAGDAASIAKYAPAALTSADYTTFQNLTVTYGQVTNGQVTLTTAGLAQFRAAATAQLNNGTTATDAQVQAYANTLYQGFKTTVQAYAPTLYQSLVTVFGQAYGSGWKTNPQVVNYAANSAALLTLTSYGQVVNGVFTLNGGAIGDAAVANYAAAGLSSAQYGLFQTLTQNGSVNNGTLTLTAAGVVNYAAAALGAGSANYTTFQVLTTTGNATVNAAGVLTLTAAGVAANASAALGATYSAFQTLTSSTNATVGANGLALTAAGINAYASAALSTQQATTFQNLTSGANGSVTNGVLTLTPAGVAFFKAAAAAAFGIATPTDAQIQAYANAQYQGLTQTIQSYASSQYKGYAQTVQAYAAAKYQTYAQTIQSYANGQYQGYAQTIQSYAVAQYQPLQTATTFNATPAVAFSLLSASGSLQNGAFVLTNSGILSYAKSALSSASYAQFAGLLNNGTLSGGTFQLNSNGVSSMAQAALTQDYQNFQTLYTNGSLVNGVWTLTAAGIAAFRQAAATAQNPNPTDAQVQTYADALYRSYAANINGAANVQYQGYLTSISTAATTAYRNFASEVVTAYNQYFGGSMTIDMLLGPNATYIPSAAQQFVLNYSWLIPAVDRTALTSLSGLGSIQNGTFVLAANNVATYAPTGLSAANYSAYSLLLATSTMDSGVLKMTPAGLNNMALAQLTPNYQSYVNLTSSGALQNGNFVFSSSGVLANAQAGVNAAYTSFQQLMANGTVTNGVFTLTSSGLAAYTSIAAAALGIASPTATQVQAYANQQYQNSLFNSANPAYQSYAQSIMSGAQTQYTSLAAQVFAYLVQHDQQCNFMCSGPILAQGQTTITDAQMAQYASQALYGTDLQAYQAFVANGSVSNGVLTLTTAGLGSVSSVVLSAPLATAFNALLGTGSVQNGQFVLTSAAALQKLQTLATTGTSTSGVFQFNTAGILANASTALGTTGLQQLLVSGTVQSTTVNGVSTSSLVLNDPGVAYYAPAALSAVNYQLFQGLTASANGEVVNGVLTLSAGGIAQFSAAAAAALHLGTTAPTAAQVQAYANGQYQTFAATIKNYANSQFQGYGSTFQSYANGQYQPLQQQVLNYATNNLNVEIDLASGTYRTTSGFGGGTCQLNSCSITNAVLADWAQRAHAGTTNNPWGGGNGFGTISTADYNSFITMLGQGTVQAGALTLNTAALQGYYSNLTSSSSILSQSYQVFQTIVGAGNSTIQNGVLTLTSAGITNVRAAAASFLGNNPTDAQVQAFAAQAYTSDLSMIQGYAATQYQSYATSISSYGNTQYQSLVQTVQNYANSLYQADVATIQAYGNSQYQALTANGTPQVSAGILSMVANSVYSTGQIVSTLSKAALLPSAGSVGTNAVASIVGRNVTLNAANSIGTAAPSVVIALTDLKNGTITTDQQAALSVATTPGSITFSATLSAQALTSLDVAHLGPGVTLNGNVLSGLTLSTLPNGITVNDLTSVALAQTAPVYVNASGTFNATAGTTVYVQAAASAGQPVATLTVGQITAGGDVTLLAPQSILTATNSSGAALFANQVVINPSNGAIGNLTLAATNAIGSAANAFSYHINGKLISAQAGTDAYLTATEGDATFGKVFANNTISLTATNGSILSYLAGVTMAANNIILNATGDVGTQNSPFTLQVGATGMLSGTIGGGAFIYSPTLATQNPMALNVGNLTAVNGLTLIGDAGISFGGAAGSSQGSVTVCSGPCLTGSTAVGGSITMAANASIQAAQLIRLTAPGDIVLGQLTSTASPASTVRVITITSSNGAITANGDGHTNMTATAANAEVSLSATSVGTTTQRVSVNTPLLTATAGSGGIYVGSAGDLHASLLSATHGSVDIVSSGKLTLDSVLAGTAAGASGTFNARTVTAIAGDLVIGAATSSGAMTVDSAGTLGFTQLDTTVGAIALSAVGNVTGGTLAAGAALSVTSSTGSIALATASSGGSQTIRANQNVTFNSLTTTGTSTDVGDVAVTATNGFVLAQTVLAGGTATQGSVAASGSVSLSAGTTNTGRMLTAATGSGSITGGGQVDWTSLTAATTLGVTSSTGSITLATASSGGS